MDVQPAGGGCRFRAQTVAHHCYRQHEEYRRHHARRDQSDEVAFLPPGERDGLNLGPFGILRHHPLRWQLSASPGALVSRTTPTPQPHPAAS